MQQVQEELVACKDHAQINIKGKRTKRQRLPSPLRLAMPVPSTSSSLGRSSTDNSVGLDLATTSPTTTSVEFRDRTEEEEDMANCLILLAQGHHTQIASQSPSQPQPVPVPDHNNKAELCLYQCKTCNRCFPSFQALGGHRASHKKPKANNSAGTEEKQAATATTFVNHGDDHHDPTTNTILFLQISNGALYSSSTATATKSKVHECSICGAEFSSGQALGGHMRRHRTFVSASTTITTTTSMSPDETQEAKKPRNVLKLDLNLPAPEDDHRESKFPFQPKEKVIVFSASSLVDCHY